MGGRRDTGLPDGGDGGLTAGLAVEGRGRVAEHGLLERHPLGRAGVDRVGRRHPRRVGVRRRRVVVVPLGPRRRVVGDADGGLAAGGRGVLGRHGLRRRAGAGALVWIGAFGFGERLNRLLSAVGRQPVQLPTAPILRPVLLRVLKKSSTRFLPEKGTSIFLELRHFKKIVLPVRRCLV